MYHCRTEAVFGLAIYPARAVGFLPIPIPRSDCATGRGEIVAMMTFAHLKISTSSFYGMPKMVIPCSRDPIHDKTISAVQAITCPPQCNTL